MAACRPLITWVLMNWGYVAIGLCPTLISGLILPICSTNIPRAYQISAIGNRHAGQEREPSAEKIICLLVMVVSTETIAIKLSRARIWGALPVFWSWLLAYFQLMGRVAVMNR